MSGKPVLRVRKEGSIASLQRGAEASTLLPPKMSAETTIYLPVPLIQKALEDSLNSVSISRQKSALHPDLQAVDIVVHPDSWRSSTISPNASTFELLIDSTSHEPVALFNLARFDGRTDHVRPHMLIFSEYRDEGGWLVPSHIDELFSGAVRTVISLTAFEVNGGLPSLTSNREANQ
jgi:hypothetical protein